MSLVPDMYVFANPFFEPISLEALARPDEEDGRSTTYALADPNPGPDERAEDAEAQAAIGRFLESLQGRDRELLTRIFWQDQTQADVARAFKVSAAAVSKRMNRIFAQGRTALCELRDHRLLQ